MDEKLFLSLVSVLEYLEATNNSRCLIEGESVLQAKHLIVCGQIAQECTEHSISIFALCLQTSHLTGKPHEINGKLMLDQDNVRIAPFKCSCKAGSGKYKHIAAALLHCNRYVESRINELFLLFSFT